MIDVYKKAEIELIIEDAVINSNLKITNVTKFDEGDKKYFMDILIRVIEHLKDFKEEDK